MARPLSSCRRAARRWSTPRGFTYVGLLILVAIIGVAATATIQLGSVVQRREAEQELLAVGLELMAAFASYRNATPVGRPPFPREFEDLLKDPRHGAVRRHLRRLPADPITGEISWGVVRSTDGFITGVHSLSDKRPIKVGNFEAEVAALEGKGKYSEWVFSAYPVTSQSPQSSK